MTHISVSARTQRIVVDPASSAVAVINMGPQGPIGGAFSYVKSDGSVPMTGDLVLAGDPNSALEAAPKQYVDTKVGLEGDMWRSGSVTLNDDQACYVSFTASQIMSAAFIVSNLSSSGSALVFFRASGDANSAAAILAQNGATWVASAGAALTGTTGVDGQQTVRVINSGSQYRLYIENRTGGQKSYSIILFGPNQDFTIVTV